MTDLVSVVVCTYNRSASLARTLDSLAAQETGRDCDLEVIIVDNNSRDDTKAVVEGFKPRIRGLRYLFEGRQGLSHARNAGVACAQGSIVAFTDDDVRPEPDWIKALVEAFRLFTADCVYGKVLPDWETERPRWLGDYFLGRLALLDRGDEPFLIADERHEFYGANFAVTKAALAGTRLFNPALGRSGTQLGGGEDVDYFTRLFRAGRRIAYQPFAVVHHWISRERMSPSYFRRWHFQHGESSAHLNGVPGRRLFGVPLWAARDCVDHLGGWAAGLVTRRADRRLVHEMRLFYYAGLMSQTLRLRGRRSY